MEKEGIDSELMRRANIPLVLNSYMDIFSSFDPRPYSDKALSDDFLIECKRAVREKENSGIELVLAVPSSKRSLNDEFKIKKRLREHFHKHFAEKQRELAKISRMGVFWVILGVLIMIGVIYLLINIENTFFVSLLTIFEIPSWFLIWEGMGKIFFDSKKIEPDFKFYQKMVNCQVVFHGY